MVQQFLEGIRYVCLRKGKTVTEVEEVEASLDQVCRAKRRSMLRNKSTFFPNFRLYRNPKVLVNTYVTIHGYSIYQSHLAFLFLTHALFY